MPAASDPDANLHGETSESVDVLSPSEMEELARMVFERLLQELEIEHERTGKQL